ncbi:MAG: MFS transporter [Pseudomonadales bacterium]|nr:MFS transporter [Pseudomonadales bacterium]MBO6597871.1 MFS transporter [Pseudomonadales bacterium]MBO6824279.1 MFS transporter [Pseudomonadales bacterium]
MSSRWLLLLGVWLLYGSFGLVATSLAPMASLIIEDLSMTHAQMGMAMGAWQLVYIFSAVPAGILLDRIGPQYALALGGILVGSSALARVFAGDATSLIAAVMLFGLGGPIISAGAPKVVVSIFEGSSRGLAMGIYMTGPAIGGIVSLTTTHSFLLPWFNQDWRDVMALWTLVTFASAAIWFLIATLNRSSDSAESAAASVSQIRVIGELISKPTVMIVLLMSISVFMFNHGLNNWLPELLQSHGLSAVHAGYWAALPTVIGIIGSLIIPRLATPERRFNILLALSAAAFLASLLLRFNEPESLITGLLLQGIARSSLMTVLILTLVELPEIGERYAGVASGLFFSAAELGGVMGPLTLGFLYTPSGGFTNGLTLLTMITLTMILGSLLLKQRARASSA